MRELLRVHVRESHAAKQLVLLGWILRAQRSQSQSPEQIQQLQDPVYLASLMEES